jgi:hypothetical protein
MPATGKHVDLPYVEIYHFNTEGKVSSGHAYFDQLGLLAQLGQAQVPSLGFEAAGKIEPRRSNRPR